MAVEVNLDALLVKEWENKTLSEILDAPLAALAGVSDGDADLLKQAFNIKTVGDLGRNKYFRAAPRRCSASSGRPGRSSPALAPPGSLLRWPSWRADHQRGTLPIASTAASAATPASRTKTGG
jgi:hypothetical protein